MLRHWLSRRIFRLPSTADRVAREIDDELDAHIRGRIEELIEQGLSPAEAHAEVDRRFGSVRAAREACLAIDERARRRTGVRDAIGGMAQDIAFAVRLLRRRPAFTATVLLTLALGIGATTAMFTVVNGVLLAPLPYREPGRLMTIYYDFSVLAREAGRRRDLGQAADGMARLPTARRQAAGVREHRRASHLQRIAHRRHGDG